MKTHFPWDKQPKQIPHTEVEKQVIRYSREARMDISPEIGQAVMVIGGKYNGCILTFIGWDKLTGKPICQHSEYPGGLRVLSVVPLIS